MAPAASRKRRAQPEPDDSSSAASSPEPATQRRRTSPDDGAFASDHGTTTLNEPVKKMVRLALACEYQRRPIRRADISEKVLAGQPSRQFKRVFDEAQTQLRAVFGMEMVELPARGKVTVREKRAQKVQEGKKAVASWVLRSTLPTEFHDPEILPPAAAPTSAEEGTYMSIYTVLISLISLSGGALPDAKLERYLRRLGMEDTTPVTGYQKTEQLLKRMEREGYVVKVKEPAGAGEEDVSWHVGPRGRVEVGDEGTKGLANAVYGELDGEEDKELQRRIVRSLGMGERERVVEDKQKEANGTGTAKKRGRKRKDASEEEEEDDDED